MKQYSDPGSYVLDQPQRILVDRRKALGDLIMITPVMRELRKRYPRAWIQLVTEELDVFDGNPDINLVVKPDGMRKEDPWDLYINLNDAYELNPKNHFVDSYLMRAFGTTQGIDKSLSLYESEEERETTADLIKQIDAPYVVIHMRRWAWENKNIDIQVWGSLISILEHKWPELKFVSVGAQYDYKLQGSDRWIALNDELSLGQIKCLIAGARAFVGSDSGPFHIAGTTNTPIVAMLNHVLPQHILPWRNEQFGDRVWVCQSTVECVGCYSRQSTPVRQLTCENSDQWACNRNWNGDEFIAHFEEIMKL
jgi:heptosyltransferase III